MGRDLQDISPTNPLFVGVVGVPTVTFSGVQPVNVMNVPAVTINGTPSVVSALTNAIANPGANGNVFAKIISALGTNASLVKAAAGRLTGGVVVNTGAAIAYLKLHSSAVAPTVGTTPVAVLIPLPTNVPVNIGSIVEQYGLFLAGGIAYSLTTGAADGDIGGVAAGQVVGTLIYV